MGLFTTIFWIAILVSAFGGAIGTVIRIVKELDDSTLSWSKALAWIIRDILAGIGAGFAAFMLNKAMDSDAGLFFITFLAGIAGVTALNQFLEAQGLKNERDLLAESMATETDIINKLYEHLEESKQDLRAKDELLTEAQKRLRAMENEAKRMPLDTFK